MWKVIKFNNSLTLGELRKVVNNDLSDFPDDSPINMCVNSCLNNTEEILNQYCSPVMSIIGDEKEINFYNFI